MHALSICTGNLSSNVDMLDILPSHGNTMMTLSDNPHHTGRASTLENSTLLCRCSYDLELVKDDLMGILVEWLQVTVSYIWEDRRGEGLL